MDSRVFYAAQNGDIDQIERLYKEKPELLHEVTLNKNNVLHIAARGGHSDFVRWIRDTVIEDYSSMRLALNSDRNTPLHEAAYCGDADLVRIFMSPLDQAWRAVVADTVSDFISSFVCVSEEQKINNFGEKPLLIACKFGHEEAATVLLEKATPINLKYLIYQPCLHLAAYGGHLGVVKLLLNENNMKRFQMVWMRLDADGVTPLHAAICGGHIDIVREMLNPLLSSYWRKWLMTKEDSNGNCAIHAAILKGKDDVVHCLISSMPECIEIRNAKGNTSLHLAAQNAENPQNNQQNLRRS